MAQVLTSVTGGAGIYGVGLLATSGLEWHFRPQSEPDVGIGAHVEPVLERPIEWTPYRATDQGRA